MSGPAAVPAPQRGEWGVEGGGRRWGPWASHSHGQG